MSSQSKSDLLLSLNAGLAEDDIEYKAQVTALNQASVICHLRQFKLLRVSGEDAATFLQGQLCNDIRLLNENNAQYTGYSSAKGRLMASFLCWKSGDDYFLLSSSDLSESIVKRLSMFILRAKVKLIIDEDKCLLGFNGLEVETELAVKGYALPDKVLQLTQYVNNSIAIRLPNGSILLVMASVEADQLLQSLPDALPKVSDEAWSLLDIAAGIPWITAATQEQFVAQMVNMDLFGAISFTKGCYPGQEIIARTHYLGKIKRRMYRVQLSILTTCGTSLYSPGMGDQSIGMIINVARDAMGQYQALASIQSASWAAGIYLDAAYQIPIVNLSLPYSLLDE